jgi:hypothetical protein
MVKFALYLTLPQRAALDQIKAETGIGASETIRRALDAHLTAMQPVASPKPVSAKRRGRRAK